MAVSLRVLIHDTPASTSLLTHLGIKNSARLLSTFEPIKREPGVLVASIPLWVDSTGHRKPPLGDDPYQEFLPANEWWTQLVMTGNNDLSRKDIILAAANQVLSEYSEDMARQTREIQKTTSLHAGGEAQAQVQLRFSASGVEALVRYPVQLQRAAEIDERISRELLKVITDAAA